MFKQVGEMFINFDNVSFIDIEDGDLNDEYYIVIYLIDGYPIKLPRRYYSKKDALKCVKKLLQTDMFDY